MATVESIQLLLERAHQLQKIRSACRQFVALALEASLSEGANSAGCDAQDSTLDSSDEESLADPHNFDWSLLYRGSVLDD